MRPPFFRQNITIQNLYSQAEKVAEIGLHGLSEIAEADFSFDSEPLL
jgi:hypothetical protein